MKNKLTKILSICLVIGIVCTGSIFVYAQQAEAKKTNQNSNTNNNEASLNIKDIVQEQEYQKEEKVYVISNADGSVKKVIVSDWLKNTQGNDIIEDSSKLKDIVNVKGEETYTENGGSISWNANGKDIYYQGTIEDKLPIEVSVVYKLDGKEINPQDLVGKSGNVSIELNYINNLKQNINVNGKSEEVYMPFVMLSGLVLDNDNFTNINVSNGKIINDGDRTIVVGFAMPKLQESLMLDKDKLDIPEKVVISADVKDFSLATTVTFATNEIFNNVDLSNVNSIDGILNSLTKLDDAANQLVNGSSMLYDGMCTLLEKSNQLVSGIGELTNGANTLVVGVDSLYKGTTNLQSGANALSVGLKQLNDNSTTLNTSAEQIFNLLLANAQNSLKAKDINVPTLKIDNYNAILSSIPVPEGVTTIKELIAQLDSYKQFYMGLKSYTDGVGNAYLGSNKINAGMGELANGGKALSVGANSLYKGMLTLEDGSKSLIAGIKTLKESTMQLSQGMQMLNEQGIQQIVKLADSDMNSILERAKALVEVSKSYGSFSGKNDDMTGKVEFIYRTDAIE